MMCRVFMCLTLACGVLSAQERVIEQPSQAGTIKVLLFNQVDGLNLEVRGGFKVYDPKTGKKIGASMTKKSFFIQPTLDGISWGETYPGTYQIAVVPSSSILSLVNGIQYAGSIYVYQVGSKISVVNELSVEDFVKSMLSKEINEPKPHETLAALAILMRTKAYYHAKKSEGAFWHLDAKEIDYQGYSVTLRDNGVEEAVEVTKNLVMQVPHGYDEGLFDATYTAHCAGKTVPYHLVYRKEGYAPHKGVEAPYAAYEKAQSAWKYSLSEAALAKKLNLSQISSFEFVRDPQSDKVIGAYFFEGDRKTEIDFMKLQKLVGSSKLKSNDFKVSLVDHRFTFEGFGEGNGVGLCVFSAEKMGEKGYNAPDILQTFFQDAKVVLYH